jgi:Xaa-Pro aminopeptidase
LTWAPIDRNLVDRALLTPDERAWVDAYHQRTLEIVGPQLDGDALAWVRDACAPL